MTTEHDEEDQIIPTFSGEVMLAGWRENHSNGATITFWLPDSSDLDIFRGLTCRKGNTAGQRFMTVLVLLDDEGNPVPNALAFAPTEKNKKNDKEPEPHGKAASQLYKQGFFYARPVLMAIGTQEEYIEWCSQQPCVVTGGEGKPFALNEEPYHLISLSPELHGEAGSTDNLRKLTRKLPSMLSRWMASTVFDRTSMGFVEPSRLTAWAAEHRLLNYLPKAYRSGLNGGI